jgi:hypothetical protein
MNKEFISKHTSANPNTVKLFVPYLETRENELTAEGMAYIKPQIEQLNAQHTFCVEPR